MNNTLGPTDEQVTRMRSAVLAASALRRSHRTRYGIIIAAIGTAALASAAAAAVIAPATVDQRNTSVDCYTRADLSSAHGTTAFVDNGRDTSTLAALKTRTALALALCAASQSAVATDPNLRTTPIDVPNPTVCQLDDLRLAVLPNKNNLGAAAFCTQLGLAAPHA